MNVYGLSFLLFKIVFLGKYQKCLSGMSDWFFQTGAKKIFLSAPGSKNYFFGRKLVLGKYNNFFLYVKFLWLCQVDAAREQQKNAFLKLFGQKKAFWAGIFFWLSIRKLFWGKKIFLVGDLFGCAPWVGPLWTT